jgi:CBS domain-containing protein
LVTVLLLKRSILTEKIARRGHHLVREYRIDAFALARVRDVMTTDVVTLPDTMTLHQTVNFLTDPTTKHPSFPVVDAARRVVGIVDPPTVIAWRRAGRHRRMMLGELLKDTSVPIAHPDEYLEGVIDRMTRLNVAHLAVIASDDPTLVGYLSWRDLLRVRLRLQQEDVHGAFSSSWVRRRRRKVAKAVGLNENLAE